MLTELLVAGVVLVLIWWAAMLIPIVLVESKAGERFFDWLDKAVGLVADRFLGGKR